MFQPAARVRYVPTGQIGHVVESAPDLTKVLFVNASSTQLVATSSLEAFPEESLHYLEPDVFLRSLTAYKLRTQLSDVVYGYLASRTQFRPYQFLPVLRFLDSPIRRVLIADEVGLGKTIEAGLIWLELVARGQAERVLVLCPPHLREKWRRELLSRFDIEAKVILRGAELDDLISDLNNVASHVDRPRSLIVSLNLIAGAADILSPYESRAEALVATGISWDLVIVDEAHHARNTGTRRNAALEILGEATEAQLFLTATPLNLGTPDLFNLLRLLHPDRFQSHEAFVDLMEPAKHVTDAVRALRVKDRRAVLSALRELSAGSVGKRLAETTSFKEAERLLADPDAMSRLPDIATIDRALKDLHPLAGVFTRTRKRDLTEPFARRDVRRVPVSWTNAEWQLYDAVIALAQRRAFRNPFAVVMPARQSASCLQAMANRIREGDWNYAADLEESEEGDGRLESPEPTRNSSGVRELRAALSSLGSQDSKYDAFRKILSELFAADVTQVLVFSFFKRTLNYLRDRLKGDGYGVSVIHGDVPLDERQRLMDLFRAGEIQILLSSEVGSEGLDFEFCGCLVNYDLPWNPMRVEQRIGRLDRFGQQHEKIIIVNFQIDGTIETDIFDRLYERIGVFEQSIGDLDDILGDEIEAGAFEIARNLKLTESEREEQLEQLALNFERRRKIVEDLENHRELLAASEDLLHEELEQIRESGRYIDPGEIERLVKGYLAREYSGTSWGESIPGVYNLLFDRRLGDSDGPLGRKMSDPTLRGFRNNAMVGNILSCTFDPARAARDARLEFITGRHPLTQAIADIAAPTQLPFAAAMAVQTSEIQSGMFVISLYEAEIDGIDLRRTLIPVAVGAVDRLRHPGVESAVLGVLARSNGANQLMAVDELKVAAALRASERMVALDRTQLEETARVDNELLYERRLRGVDATFQPKISAARLTLSKTVGTRVEQANRGRVNNLENRYAEELRKLEEGREPHVSLRHVGVIVLDVTSAPTSEPAGEAADEVESPNMKSTAVSDVHVQSNDVGSDRGPLCSRCDTANLAAQGGSNRMGPRGRCARCGVALTGRCHRCKRWLGTAGCVDRFVPMPDSPYRLLVADRTRLVYAHFTEEEAVGLISRGSLRRETRLVDGDQLDVVVFRSALGEVLVHEPTKRIVGVSRLATLHSSSSREVARSTRVPPAEATIQREMRLARRQTSGKPRSPTRRSGDLAQQRVSPKNRVGLVSYVGWDGKIGSSFDSLSRARLVRAMQEIIRAEAPVTTDRIYRLIARDTSVRLTRPVRNQLDEAASSLKGVLVAEHDNPLTDWPQIVIRPRGTRKVVVRQLGPRELYEVPLDEVTAVLKELGARGRVGEDTLRAVLDVYGIDRMTEKARTYLSAAVELL